MPEQIGQFYPTQVPSYTEAADIRKAFNLYHYGTEVVPTDETQILSSSMAGYIRDTLAAIDAAQIGETVISALTTENLNDLTQSGVYKSATSPTTALNYPSTSPGILNYWQTTDNTFFQTYISTAGNMWWRAATQPQATRVWTAWAKAALENHTHDTRYYTQSQINAKLTATPTASTVPVYNASSQIVSSTVTSTELGHLSGATSNLQTQIDSKSATTHIHDDRYYIKASVSDPGVDGEVTARVFVKDPATGNPFGAAEGDLWFW